MIFSFGVKQTFIDTSVDVFQGQSKMQAEGSEEFVKSQADRSFNLSLIVIEFAIIALLVTLIVYVLVRIKKT